MSEHYGLTVEVRNGEVDDLEFLLKTLVAEEALRLGDFTIDSGDYYAKLVVSDAQND